MSPCEIVPTPTGTAIVCSRGGPTACSGLGQEVKVDGTGTTRCPRCGRRVETYESDDGRLIALRHRE